MAKDIKDKSAGPGAVPGRRRWRPLAIAVGVAFALGFATPILGAWALGALPLVGQGGGTAGEPGRAVVPVPEILTNLAPGSKARLIRTSVALVVPAASEPAVRGDLDRIRDSFLEYCRQLGDSDLRGSVGLYRMRGDLLRRARALAGDAAVVEVLIQDLVLQ
ncbi:flagellar basal body-associated FliL family protein [Inquilinus sp. NPDC058860]|uniref:flagellar basal body-associated FliL family protein n=1 Tax=Inquilinus sp. NPDC058860 TaxID=3346652 RepID=UPI003685B95B